MSLVLQLKNALEAERQKRLEMETDIKIVVSNVKELFLTLGLNPDELKQANMMTIALKIMPKINSIMPLVNEKMEKVNPILQKYQYLNDGI